MKKQLMLWGFYALSFFSLHAQPKTIDHKQRLEVIHANIYTHFFDSARGLFRETTDSARNEHPHSYLWPLCALLQAANEMEQLQPSKAYMEPVMKAIQQYYRASPPAPGYQAYVTQEKNDSRFYDDNQWIAIACLDAYQRTKEKRYLATAQEIYAFMMTGHDEASGGGLYWKEDEKNTKNTCSNGPGILVALQLYKVTGDKKYLNTGLALYEWTNRHLLSAQGVYYDAIKIPSLRIDSATYTYNTGTMLEANVQLFTLTKEPQYLREAQRIARLAEAYFYRNNRLPDNYWFNVVLMRGYVALYKVDKNKKPLQFLLRDAERVWQQENNALALLGRHPDKRLIDQAAMLEMYARIEQLQSGK